MAKEKVLMAMSGGIDSTVAAILLLEQGYELVGVTFRTFDCGTETKEGLPLAMYEAREMAQRLGFEHHIVDFRHTFKKCVIDDFIQEYMRGRTPNPCVKCNSSIKWGALLEKANELGCRKIATGHYARICRKYNRYLLQTAADTKKDQTYFLWMLNESDLSRTLFPLGGLTKSEVREIAYEHGFVKLSQKAESQEICFIPDNDYRKFLSENVADFASVCHPGNFLMNGRVVGQHKGFPNYTIGQRKGLVVAFGTPKYVTDIDAANNTVTLGDRDDLYVNTLSLSQSRFTDRNLLENGLKTEVRIRYKSAATPADVVTEGERVRLVFERPVWGVTPGQSAVIYQDGCVIGGGIIEGI